MAGKGIGRLNGWATERGAGLAEYALLLAIVAAACVSALSSFGSKISSIVEALAGAF